MRGSHQDIHIFIRKNCDSSAFRPANAIVVRRPKSESDVAEHMELVDVSACPYC